MRKIFMPAILLAVMAMASCSDGDMEAVISSPSQTQPQSPEEQQAGNGIEVVIKANIDNSKSLSKTSFNHNSGTPKYQFDGGEYLALFNSENGSKDKLQNTDTKGTSATFEGTISTDKADEYYGVVPYSAAGSISDGRISFTLPRNQEIGRSQFDPAAHIIVAKSSTYENLEFFTANSFLLVRIPGGLPTFNTIKITSNNGEKIAGTVSYDPSSISSYKEIGNMSSSITVTGSFSNGDFYISLLPCTLSKGFNITLSNNFGDSYSKNFSQEVKFIRNQYTGIKTSGLWAPLKVSLSDLGWFSNVPITAAKVVFDRKSNFPSLGTATKTVANDKIGIYVDGDDYYILSEKDEEICMTNSLNAMFFNYHQLKSVELNNFNIADISSMSCMFYDCSSLESLNLGDNFNTANATNMDGVFAYCSSLKSLDLGDNFNTAKAEDINGMFIGCTSLKSLDLGDNFNTANATNMSGMFGNCSSLTTIKVNNDFDLTNLQDDDYMFDGCTKLKGQNGTSYSDANPAGAAYARIDVAGNPGYFTKR